MSGSLGETFGTVKHEVSYRILNHTPQDPARKIEVYASPEEINQLAEQGFLVRQDMFIGESLENLRRALDELEDLEKDRIGISSNSQFGGLFLRYLMDKHPVFLEFLKFQPFLSIARALMGPQVKVGMSARISYPGDENQQTIWHQHLRYVPNPLPPWFTRPHGMDVLVYLDDANEANGPLCVMAGTHNDLQDEPPGDYFEDIPGQIILRPQAGTAVFMHSNLWHRAMPTTPQGTKRRLLLFGYTPTWLKTGFVSGEPPKDGLTEKLRVGADDETLELLGYRGYM